MTQEFGVNHGIPKGEDQTLGKSDAIPNIGEPETGISTTEESRHEEGHNKQALSTSVDEPELSDTLQLHEDTKENDKLPLESSTITSPTESGSSDTEETPSISEGPKGNEQKKRDDDSLSKISVSPENSRPETDAKDTSNLLKLKGDVDISMPKAVIGSSPNDNINVTEQGDNISGVNSKPLSDDVRPDKNHEEVKEHTSNSDNVQQSGGIVNMNVEKELKDTLENPSSSLDEGKAHEELSEPNLSSDQDMSNTPGPLDNTSEETTERISNNEYKVNEREGERTLTKEYEDIVLKSHMNRESDDGELYDENSDLSTVNDESEDAEAKMKGNDTSEMSHNSSQHIESDQQKNDMKTVGDLGTTHVQNEISVPVTGEIDEKLRESKESKIHKAEEERLSHTDIHKINPEDRNSNTLHLKDIRNEENERHLTNQNINISQERDLQKHGFHTMNNLHGDGVSERSQINHSHHGNRQDRGGKDRKSVV